MTVRRSLVSRHRVIRPRFSSRSSSRVTSGSRVIIRLAISPHGRPSGVPRRIRSTLYCVGETSSVFRTPTSPRDSMSVVRSNSRNADSSGLPVRRPLFPDTKGFFMSKRNIIRYNDCCQDGHSSLPSVPCQQIPVSYVQSAAPLFKLQADAIHDFIIFIHRKACRLRASGGPACSSRAFLRGARADHDVPGPYRQPFDSVAKAAGVPVWIGDALRFGRSRASHLSDQHHGHAYPEPARRSSRQLARDSRRRQRRSARSSPSHADRQRSAHTRSGGYRGSQRSTWQIIPIANTG